VGTISIELAPLLAASSRILSAKLLAAALLLISGSLVAQPVPARGPSLVVGVEIEGRDVAVCGVQPESLKSIAGFVLNSAKISRVEAGVEADTNVLDINGLIMAADAGPKSCFGSLTVEVVGLSLPDLRGLPLNGFTSKTRKTVLCAHASNVGGPTGTFSGIFSSSLERLIKECLGRLKY